jgi:hypothetical protein
MHTKNESFLRQSSISVGYCLLGLSAAAAAHISNAQCTPPTVAECKLTFPASFQRQHKSRILKALQITCITDATAALLYAHARQRKEQCRAVAIELACEKKRVASCLMRSFIAQAINIT